MRYYIVKPKSHNVDMQILSGIMHLDAEAQIVSSIDESDVVILQKGWTRSGACVKEKVEAVKAGKRCKEGHLYITAVSVRLNSGTSGASGLISKQDTIAAIIRHLGIKSEKYLLPAEKSIVDVIKGMPEMPSVQK